MFKQPLRLISHVPNNFLSSRLSGHSSQRSHYTSTSSHFFSCIIIRWPTRGEATPFVFLLANTAQTGRCESGPFRLFSSTTLVVFFFISGSTVVAAGETSGRSFGRRAECIHSNLGAEISCGSGYCCSGRRSVRIEWDEEDFLRIFLFSLVAPACGRFVFWILWLSGAFCCEVCILNFLCKLMMDQFLID